MYELLTDMNLLNEAFIKCKKSISWKCSVQRYEANLLINLNRLCTRLENFTYVQKPFYEFDICERGKFRHIKSLHISDRVLQRSLCDNILNPTFCKYLIYDNGASIKNKGVDFARNRLVTHLQRYYRKHGHIGYILLIDYKKFFDSIDHNLMISMFSKHIEDKRVMNLLSMLIDQFAIGDEKVSLGIGSQISQIGGVYYLHEVDNYCKIVKQCKYYGRYMDDIYIIHHNKKFLQDILLDIREISNKLGLSIHDKKTQICRIDKCFVHLKLRVTLTKTGKVLRRISKDSITRERRKLKKLKLKLDSNKVDFDDILLSYKSWRGSLKKYNSYHTIQNMDHLFDSLFISHTNGVSVKNL